MYKIVFRLTRPLSGMRYFLLDTMRHYPTMSVGFVSVSRILDTALIILRNQIKGWDRAIRFRAEGSWSLP